MNTTKHIVVFLFLAATITTHAGTTTYQYDTRGRLTGMASEGGATEFQSDAANNITERKTVADTDGDGIADEWEISSFGNLTTANASSDYDHDGQSDYAEYISGTDPKNAASYLLVQSQPNATGFSLSWPSQTNRTYTLERSTNLLAGFTVFQIGIAATPPMNTALDTSATTAQLCYYRIKLID